MFLFSTTVSGTIAATVVGSINDAFADSNGDVDPVTLGYIMTVSTVVPCIFAAMCFKIAGNHYVAFKIKQTVETEDVMTKASHYNYEQLSQASKNRGLSMEGSLY